MSSGIGSALNSAATTPKASGHSGFGAGMSSNINTSRTDATNMTGSGTGGSLPLSTANLKKNSMYSSNKFPTMKRAESMKLEELQLNVERITHDNELLAQEIAIFTAYGKRVNPNLDDQIDAFSEVSSQHSHHDSGTNLLTGKSKQTKRRDYRKKSAALDQIPTLSVEHKLEIVSRELEEVKREMKLENEQLDESEDKIRAMMEETYTRIAEANKEHYEFRRDVVTGGINPRTGKIMAEKVIRYYEERLKQKAALIEKLKLKNQALKSQINKLTTQLQQREDMGEILKEIDFAQLKIENKQFSLKIEERNNELLRLKLTTGNTMQVLNALIEKLNRLTNESGWLKKEIKLREDALDKLKDEIEKALKEKEINARKNNKLKLQQEEIKVPEILDYVNQKAEMYELSKECTNWERKVEIHESLYKQYKHQLRSYGMLPMTSNTNGSYGATNTSIELQQTNNGFNNNNNGQASGSGLQDKMDS